MAKYFKILDNVSTILLKVAAFGLFLESNVKKIDF